MDEPETRPEPAPAPERPPSDRLDSWKKIAVYLKRDVTTVQRWERREGMPVHRHLHDKQGSVFAYRSELDNWSKSRRMQLTGEPVASLPVPADDSALAQPPGAIPPAVLAAGAAPLGEVPPSVESPVRWFHRGVVGLVLLLVVAGIVWFVADKALSWRNPLASAKFSRLSDFAGTEQAAAISPNGKLVAVLASRGGQVDAWAGEIGSGVYRNLTKGALPELVNPSIRTLGFSADSSLVYIWTRKGDGTQPRDVSIYSAPIVGGPLAPYLKDAAEFEWSRDGRWLVYHTTAPGDPIFLRERGASTARQIYVAKAGVHCHYPVWSRDGAYIYFVQGVPPNDWDIWRIRPSGSDLQRLTYHNAHVSYPVMLDRNTLVYLVTDADGSGPWIYGLDTQRPIPHRLTAGLETYTSLAASADGMRLVATTANPRSSLWRVKRGENNTTLDNPTLIAANALAPRLGPGFLVYLSSPGGGQGVWTLAQGIPREVWHDANMRITGAPTIAPDGARIAFTVEEGGRTRLLAIGKDGSNPTVLNDSLALQGNPVWSPDGRSIVSAAIHDGEPRLTRIFLDGEPPAAMLGEHSIDPVWSPDGQFLVYSGADIGTTFPVRAVAPDGRPYAIPSLILTRGARRLVVLKDPSELVVMRGEIGHKDLWVVDLQGHGERQLTALPADFTIDDFDLSPDGSELILNKVETNSDLALIERAHDPLGFGR